MRRLQCSDKYVAADIIDYFDHSQGIESFQTRYHAFRNCLFLISISPSKMRLRQSRAPLTMTGNKGKLRASPQLGKQATWTGITHRPLLLMAKSRNAGERRSTGRKQTARRYPHTRSGPQTRSQPVDRGKSRVQEVKVVL